MMCLISIVFLSMILDSFSLVASISLSMCVLHVWCVYQFCHGIHDVVQCTQCMSMFM
jgi:hypothetical protein